MTTEHRENRSLPIRTAVEPASLTLVYPYELRQMHMALYNVAPDLQVSSAQLPGKLDGGVTSYLNPGRGIRRRTAIINQTTRMLHF